MDRREFLKDMGIVVVGGGALGLLNSCGKDITKTLIKYGISDGEYDFDELLIDDYEKLIDGMIKYDTKTINGPFDGYGCGFLKGNKLLTANHIINGEYDAFLDGEQIEIIYKDKENDLAVLEVPDKYKEYEVPLGDSDELKTGHLVSNVGIPHGMKKVVKHRKIIDTEGSDRMLSGRLLGSENVFLTWYSVLPGDSGGPAYAFRDGNPEVVGMGKSMYGPYSEFHKINHIKDKLKKYI